MGVQLLKSNLEMGNEAVDEIYVLARARGMSIEKPAPSKSMCARAHACIERAVTGRNSHAQALMQVIDELKSRSAPERLPHVSEGIGEACANLQSVLSSAECQSIANCQLPELANTSGDGSSNQRGFAV